MAPVPPSVIRQAERLRHDGDEYYKKGRVGAAVDAYTEAIVLNPDVAASWAGRAACFRKKKEWVRVEEDSKKAIKLDTNSVKGHYLLGLALLERNEYAMGVTELEKAFDLAKVGNSDDHITQKIWQNLAGAKYRNWEQESSKRSLKLQKLKEECEKALVEHHFLSFNSSDAEGTSEDSTRSHVEQIEYLSWVLDKAGINDKQIEVPDYLCCKLSLEIFCDPVITPSGITYERAMILDHLRKVGQFDPTTREPLDKRQLVPNLAIKEAVRAFLDTNGWAYKAYAALNSTTSDEE